MVGSSTDYSQWDGLWVSECGAARCYRRRPVQLNSADPMGAAREPNCLPNLFSRPDRSEHFPALAPDPHECGMVDWIRRGEERERGDVALVFASLE